MTDVLRSRQTNVALQACGVKNALSAEEIEEGDVDKLVRNLLETVSEVRRLWAEHLGTDPYSICCKKGLVESCRPGTPTIKFNQSFQMPESPSTIRHIVASAWLSRHGQWAFSN